jgi:hypothetical protein
MATNLVIQDDGVLFFVHAAVNHLTNNLPKIHLFKSGVGTITRDTPLSTLLSQEADFGGYAVADLAAWSSFGPVSHVGSARNTAVLFTQDGDGSSNTIGGYFVTNDLGTLLYWAQNDDTLPVIDDSHPFYAVSPLVSIESKFASSI